MGPLILTFRYSTTISFLRLTPSQFSLYMDLGYNSCFFQFSKIWPAGFWALFIDPKCENLGINNSAFFFFFFLGKGINNSYINKKGKIGS